MTIRFRASGHRLAPLAYVEAWTACDDCGAKGPVRDGTGEATVCADARAAARGQGWRNRQRDKLVQDVCPACVAERKEAKAS